MICPDNKPDWVLLSRLDKALELTDQFLSSKIILSGGKSHLLADEISITEAESMKNYILSKRPDIESKILIEDQSDSTIDQIVRIKTEFLQKNNYKSIALVTDEIHMPRALATTKHILGNEFKVHPFPSQVRLTGSWKRILIAQENHLYNLLEETRFSVIDVGDHLTWKKYNEGFKKLTSKEKDSLLNIN